MTTFQTITDSVRFIDWLVATNDYCELAWRNDYGDIVHMLPQDWLFDDAKAELSNAWENLSWADQKFCIVSAADQLMEIEHLSALAYAG
jgi:hypothetical protein